MQTTEPAQVQEPIKATEKPLESEAEQNQANTSPEPKESLESPLEPFKGVEPEQKIDELTEMLKTDIEAMEVYLANLTFNGDKQELATAVEYMQDMAEAMEQNSAEIVKARKAMGQELDKSDNELLERAKEVIQNLREPIEVELEPEQEDIEAESTATDQAEPTEPEQKINELTESLEANLETARDFLGGGVQQCDLQDLAEIIEQDSAEFVRTHKAMGRELRESDNELLGKAKEAIQKLREFANTLEDTEPKQVAKPSKYQSLALEIVKEAKSLRNDFDSLAYELLSSLSLCYTNFLHPDRLGKFDTRTQQRLLSQADAIKMSRLDLAKEGRAPAHMVKNLRDMANEAITIYKEDNPETAFKIPLRGVLRLGIMVSQYADRLNFFEPINYMAHFVKFLPFCQTPRQKELWAKFIAETDNSPINEGLAIILEHATEWIQALNDTPPPTQKTSKGNKKGKGKGKRKGRK
ncbi:hypothetical protein [Helicobacter felistomachi]|uniref:hypothetical protein n=1 Tax=Helicobacter felistomachi TaxID=3040201 RepID=UPI002573BEE4|nr:hypothetical protein [Helicobacter sp. NHP21005]